MMSRKQSSWGAFAFKYRGAFWTIFYLVSLIFARPNWSRAVIGVFVVVIGQLYRIWAVGSITKYRVEVAGADKLETQGAFALSRNPLYFANGLIGLGMAIIARLWLVVPFILFFYLLYLCVVIPHEERVLTDLFGEEYTIYQQTVPRFLPDLSRIPKVKRVPARDDWFKSERHTIITNGLMTLLLLLRMVKL